jgi:hypothetical protein
MSHERGVQKRGGQGVLPTTWELGNLGPSTTTRNFGKPFQPPTTQDGETQVLPTTWLWLQEE